MESVAMQTISFSIPRKDARFASGLARKMGWKVIPQPRKQKSSYERSREDIKEGRIYTYASLEELIKEVEEA